MQSLKYRLILCLLVVFVVLSLYVTPVSSQRLFVGSDHAVANKQTLENPRWQILVLIYSATDFSYTDASGIHRVETSMTQAEKDRAADAATRFYEVDVPALTSGNMSPVLTIRYPSRTLTQLDSYCGFWPSEANTAPERDPAFDSVVVIWDSSGIDLITGQPADLQDCGGLTQWMGTGQTYSTFQVDSVSSNQRNVFKHEWGHSILWYYEAAGVTPQPTVDNHINDTDTRYVHCPTGETYILQDETDDNLIPNSIYNNTVGFTHDYYSGTTAKPETPTQCLGITPEAWASGGPVTKPSSNIGRYEAESSKNTLIGHAEIWGCSLCSNGYKVAYIGYNGALRFNDILGDGSKAVVTIYYINGDLTNRNATISVNGAAPITVGFAGSGDWNTVSAKSLTLNLATGSNTLEFANPTGWAPDLDYITVTFLTSNSVFLPLIIRQ